MSSPILDSLSPVQRERLAYVEFRGWFFGQVTRKDVLTRFGVATAAGTRDLALYQQLAPSNFEYSGKSYRYLPTFSPLFSHSPDRVLSALTSGFGDGERAASEPLPHEVPPRLNQPRLEVLATVTRAIVARHPLRLVYHSMKTGATPREIVPHALVDSGLRWHVRAYDRTRKAFRDLVLTRMELVATSKALLPFQVHELPDADAQWQKMVEIELVPHPRHPHPQSIMRDYGMREGRLRIRLRAAVAGYVLRQWQVDCSPEPMAADPVLRLRLANLEILNQIESAALAAGWKHVK